MPNGGMKPCCLTCKWGKSQGANIKQLSGPLDCQYHDMIVHHPFVTFCSKLTNSYSGEVLFPELDANDSPIGDRMYDWIEIIYRAPENPQLPAYYNEYVPLATVSEYRAWTEEQHLAKIRELNVARREELIQQGIFKKADQDS